MSPSRFSRSRRLAPRCVTCCPKSPRAFHPSRFEYSKAIAAPRRAVLDAGQWARRFAGVKAPFGRDGLPTVWG